MQEIAHETTPLTGLTTRRCQGMAFFGKRRSFESWEGMILSRA